MYSLLKSVEVNQEEPMGDAVGNSPGASNDLDLSMSESHNASNEEWLDKMNSSATDNSVDFDADQVSIYYQNCLNNKCVHCK